MMRERERERDATNEVKSERSGRTGVDLVGYGQGCLGGVGWGLIVDAKSIRAL